ncbi:MAG: primosomal protein N' [Phascolarctobacterium sp.]|nr:primosomal protein N' [Phascolarctobacterium sp.]
MFCVDVAINLPVKSLFKQFTYAVPAELNFLDSGWRVVVLFGAQKVEGFVVRRRELSELDQQAREKLKNVEAALGDRPWFDKEMLATAKWLADYYMCSLAEAMRLFVPGKTSIKRQAVKDASGKLLYYAYEERLKEKTVFAYKITEAGRAALALGNNKAKAQMAALAVLSEGEWLTVNDLLEYKVSAATARTLAEKGHVEVGQKRILRNSYVNPQKRGEIFTLTDEQASALEKINASVQEANGKTFLLQGITGSGKTEVYLRAAAEAVAQGKQVLMLVPEIALTAQLVKRFKAWFGDLVAVAHSKLSQNERGDVWYKMHTHQANILIGVRSAVFAPFKNLGLIIIDEEHESSYKQEERPNYHARNVALQRSKLTGAPLILGSATPDLESYYKAIRGEYEHLRLTKRATGSHLPTVEIVDMRKELQERNFSVLSRKLKQALVTTAASGEQAIVLLNRRGYSTFVMCRDCGTSITCPHCAVALVYHSAGEAMRCHYCGNTAPIPAECPTCHSRRIKFFGTGTQKAESELQELPGIRVLRMDQDSTAQKFAHADILSCFARGERNVLIGTQMVAKGHDIPNVTLVGVLSADSALNLPDFRASERTFSLLTQAAGRAGRGDKAGHVIFQAYDVENKVLQQAARQDYDSFAVDELKDRENFFYPPFAQMLKMTIWDKDEAAALALAKRVTTFLQGQQLEGKLNDLLILGPFPGLVAKVRDMYRFNIIVKAKDMQPIKDALLGSEFKEQKNLFFDVDPVNVI